MIELKEITKSFNSSTILDNVSFHVSDGKNIAILGPNGSGKTTILKSILGMVIPQKGDILFQDRTIKNHQHYRREIGYLPQIARFPDNLKVGELIRMIKDIREQTSKEDELITLFGLKKYLNKRLGKLSGGTRQKVNIVLTFMFDCPLYVLDEPTAGLDPVSLIHLKELIQQEKSKGKTFLITTHIMPLVEEIADEIIFLLEGKIYFQGSLQELKNHTRQVDLEHAIAEILKTHDQDHSI